MRSRRASLAAVPTGRFSTVEERPVETAAKRAIGQQPLDRQSETGVGENLNGASNLFAADAGAAAVVMPANTSLAKLLASHILRDGEMVLLILRPSLWFILLSSLRFVAAALVLIFAVRFVGASSMSSHSAVRSLVELGVSAISARLMWATLQWMSRLYILTDLRVLSVSGVFTVDIFDCPLRKIARTRVIRSWPERLVSVGSIEIIPQDDSLPFGLWQTIAQPSIVHEQMVATINRAKQGGTGCE